LNDIYTTNTRFGSIGGVLVELTETNYLDSELDCEI